MRHQKEIITLVDVCSCDLCGTQLPYHGGRVVCSQPRVHFVRDDTPIAVGMFTVDCDGDLELDQFEEGHDRAIDLCPACAGELSRWLNGRADCNRATVTK